MEDPSRIPLAPRTLVSLWLGAVPPLAAGLATGGLATALGGAFAVACPVLVASSVRWPVRAQRFFPLYFVALFLIAITAFELNSVAFVADTWSALILGLLVIPAASPEKVSWRAISTGPTAWGAKAQPWLVPRLAEIGSRTGTQPHLRTRRTF